MTSQQYFNPYTGKSFWGFIWQFLIRAWDFLSGGVAWDGLASDEVQIIVIAGVAVSSALVGTFLVLRRMTMLANSLSHTILLGIVIAFLLTRGTVVDEGQGHHQSINVQAMLLASFAMGIATTFLTELLTKWAKLQEDASMGIVFTSLFSIGVVAVTMLTRNAHIGTEVVMGNADALQFEDCKLVYAALVINVVLFILFFKEFKITTFDAGLARSFGISPLFFNYLLMAQVSATAIGAFRAVGVLMVLAFFTGPPLTARIITNDLKKMLLLAAAIGVCASIVGVAFSRHMLSIYGVSLSTAGVVVCTILIIYLAAALSTRSFWFNSTQRRER